MARIYLNDFEHLNSTTESIYELGDFNVLIILKDGTNLTSWDYVENPEDILYVSEDLFGETVLEGRYKDLINLKAIVTLGVGNIVTTRDMFSGCESLEEISSLDTWDVSLVDDVSNMFKGCSSLEDISALSNWKTSNIIDMSCMFMGCSSLESISPLSGWDVTHVDDMHYMFADCLKLSDISALTNWDVSNVRDFACLFEFCTSLEDISPLKYWNLVNAFNITAMFRSCVNIKDISPLANWDLTSMKNNKSLLSIFAYCSSIKNLSPLKSWDVSNINRISGLFEGCSLIKNISALKNWDVSNVTSFDFLFKNCISLTNISALSDWDISSVKSLKSMFKHCESLENVSPLRKWDVSNIYSMEGMFKQCELLVDVSSLDEWKISNNLKIDSIFEQCDLLESYPIWYKLEIIKNRDLDPDSFEKFTQELDDSFFKSNLNNFDEETQLNIVDCVDNQPLLEYIVDRSKFKYIQNIALEKITDEAVLTDIAINDHNCDISPSEDDSNPLNYKLYFYNREEAFVKIKNKVPLVKIAKESQYILDNISHLMKYIDSEEEWIDLVLNSKSIDVSLFALLNIKSQNSFERIIEECSNEEILKYASDMAKKG